MLEQSRQFVIFGNFLEMNIDKIINVKSKLTDLALKVSTTYDPTQNNRFAARVLPKTCFSLNSNDNKFSIVFGSGRIHIQENHSDSNDYEKFNKTSLKIIKIILENTDYIVNRIAINGQFLITDPKIISKLFTLNFNNNHYFNSEPFEWSCRVNNVIKLDDNFNSSVNTIISLIKNKITDEKTELTLAYDFNTVIDDKNRFTYENILSFNNHGMAFRNQVLEIK